MKLLFWISEFFSSCWKTQNFDVFFKNSYFSKKFSKFVNILQTWISSSKKYKLRDQCLKKLIKKLLIFLRVLRGKLALIKATPVSFHHSMRARRDFMLNMEAIPTHHIIRLYSTSHIIKPLLRAGLACVFHELYGSCVILQ